MLKISNEERKMLLDYMARRPYAEDKICPKCKGNGFVKFTVEEGRVPVVVNCDLCNSEGEVHDKEFDEYFDNHPLLKSLQRDRLN